MQDTDSSATPLQQNTPREPARSSSIPMGMRKQHDAVTVSPETAVRSRSFFVRILQALAALLFGKKEQPVAHTIDPVAVERAATSRAAQMPEPVAFRGESASTLATPVSVYAGKPVEQAIRKRAEQQFKSMDVTQSTVH